MMEKLLTPAEVATMLRIEPQTLRKWQSNNRIPYLKVNGAVRFSPKQIDDWLTNCEMGPALHR